MSGEAKHTPGPWIIIPPEPYDGDDEELFGSFVYPGGIEADDGSPVCTFGWLGGSGHMFENPVNPHLIAAAPRLLEALEALLENDCPITNANPFGSQVVEYWQEQKDQGHGYAHVYLDALAAIAAATGAGGNDV